MTTTQPIDVRDMAIVHRTFRNVYEESARLVRAAPTPSPGRVTFLADHIDFGIAALHHHHEDEDQLLYPMLIERVDPAQQAGCRLRDDPRALNEADRAFMMRALPAPVRMLYPILIERPWKKYASTLRNGT
jgi:hemerythrin HHE cation binding domain-containing protein